MFAKLLEAGERLLEALNEEHRVSARYPKDISEVFSYLEHVSTARRQVDDCAGSYCSALAECGFPDVPIRHVIECGEGLCKPEIPGLAT